MATAEQITTMLDLMQQQMTTLTQLQAENTRLRGNNTESKPKKPDRPIIDANLDDQEWLLFLDAWERYKEMLGLAAADVNKIRNELRASCSSDVNKLLFEYVGAEQLKTCTENELLAHIKSVAVRGVHKSVHRVEFSKMTQNEGEKATHYVGRLNSKALLCKFVVQCDCDPQTTVSYADERVAERLIAGLRNQEHQRKILAEADTLTTLKQMVERLQILEATEESASSLNLGTPSSAAAANRPSSYKAKKKTKPKQETSNTTPSKCGWCGRSSHGTDKTMERIHCPAKDQTCKHCGIKGHFMEVCKKALASPAEDAAQQQLPPTPELEVIPSNASVSFGFATAAASPIKSPDLDFRRTRRPTKER